MPQVVFKKTEFYKIGDQPRKDYGSEAELWELGKSLQVRQLANIHATEEGIVIAGVRRVLAARLCSLPGLMAVIYEKDLSELDFKNIRFTENVHRKDLTSYERWLNLEELRALHPSWTAKELGEFVKLDPSAVTKWLSPSKCITAWQEMLKEGRVGITDCYAVYQLPEKEQQHLLDMKLSGASRDTLNRTVRRKRSAPSDSSKSPSSNITIPLASGCKVTISGRKLSMQEILDAVAECQIVVRDGIKRRLDTKLFQESLKLESQKATSGETTNVVP